MKKIITFFLLTHYFGLFFGQTLHQTYPALSKKNKTFVDITTCVTQNSFFMAYVEDSAAIGNNKYHLVLQKNDKNGNFIWKKNFQFRGNSDSVMYPNKIISHTNGIIIIGMLYKVNSAVYPFLMKIDTSSGNIIFSKLYSHIPFLYSSYAMTINDLIIRKNGNILGVGEAGVGIADIYPFIYEINPLNGKIIKGTRLQDTNIVATYKEIQSIIEYGNSFYVCGDGGEARQRQFILKCDSNLTTIKGYQTPTKWISGFRKITSIGNKLYCLSDSGIFSCDTSLNISSFTTKYFNSSAFIPKKMEKHGSKIFVSGQTGQGVDAITIFDSNLNFVSGQQFSNDSSDFHDININGNTVYFTVSSLQKMSNNILYKCDSLGATGCSNAFTLSTTPITITYTVPAFKFYYEGYDFPLKPLVYNTNSTYSTTCFTSGIKEYPHNKNVITLNKTDGGYLINSENEMLSSIEIIDLNGKQICFYNNINQNAFSFSMSNQSFSIYLAKVKYGQNTQVFKLLIP